LAEAKVELTTSTEPCKFEHVAATEALKLLAFGAAVTVALLVDGVLITTQQEPYSKSVTEIVLVPAFARDEVVNVAVLATTVNTAVLSVDALAPVMSYKMLYVPFARPEVVAVTVDE
jgi:hypothetical protein